MRRQATVKRRAFICDVRGDWPCNERTNSVRILWYIWVYLRDVLEQLAKGEFNTDQLLPDVWKATHPQRFSTFRAEEQQERANQRHYRHAKRRIGTARSKPSR